MHPANQELGGWVISWNYFQQNLKENISSQYGCSYTVFSEGETCFQWKQHRKHVFVRKPIFVHSPRPLSSPIITCMVTVLNFSLSSGMLNVCYNLTHFVVSGSKGGQETSRGYCICLEQSVHHPRATFLWILSRPKEKYSRVVWALNTRP